MASSHFSGGDENLAVASRIMIAQRHYSTLAQTVIVPSTSPDKEEPRATGVAPKRTSSHLRSRSISSVHGPSTPGPAEVRRIDPSPTPPPPFPLPPTPSSVCTTPLALTYKRSFPSSFNFKSVEDIPEIDALTAGVLPLLARTEMRMKGEDRSSKNKTLKMFKDMNEVCLDFSSPQMCSTPVRRRSNKQFGHRRNRYSLSRSVFVRLPREFSVYELNTAWALGRMAPLI